MDNVFTLPFSEYLIAAKLQSVFGKRNGYSVAIPMSRQQKGYDLIVYNMNSKKALTFQVKSSKWYKGRVPKRKVNTPYVENWLWLPVFNLKKGMADIYLFFGTFPKKNIWIKRQDKSKKIKKIWDYKIFAFAEDEAIKLMNYLKDVIKKKSFDNFAIGFNDDKSGIFYFAKSNRIIFQKTDIELDDKLDLVKKALE